MAGKTADGCSVSIGEKEMVDYPPHDMGIKPRSAGASGDYIEFSWCLDCGQIQGNWPMKPCKLEKSKATNVRE